MDLVIKILDMINFCVNNCKDDKNGKEIIRLELNWRNQYVILDYTLTVYDNSSSDYNSAYREMIGFHDQRNLFSKDRFIMELIHELRKFSIINYETEISFYEICGIKKMDDRLLFHSKSCRSFQEKVLFVTNLSRLRMLELNLNDYGAEIYLFVLPIDQQDTFDNAIFTSDSYDVMATQSFSVQIINADEKFEKVSFIGRIQKYNLNSLTECLERICCIMKKHITKKFDRDESIEVNLEKSKNYVIDLTESTIDPELEEPDDDLFYELITSDDDIDNMNESLNFYETDEYHYKLSIFCDNQENFGENELFKSQIEFYTNEDFCSDNVARKSTLNEIDERNDAVLKRKDEEIFFSRSFGFLNKPSTTNDNKKKTLSVKSQITRIVPIEFTRDFIKKSDNKERPRSRLFDENEVDRWRSLRSKRTNSHSKAFNEFRIARNHAKERLNAYKIPKLSINQTPSSVRSFIGSSESILIEDDNHEDFINNTFDNENSEIKIVGENKNQKTAGSSSKNFFKNRKVRNDKKKELKV